LRTEIALLAFFASGIAQADVHYDISVTIDASELRGRAVVTRDGSPPKEARWSRRLTPAPSGRFLPASSGWYPGAGDELASYTLSVDVAGGDVAVAPGTLADERTEPGHYRARFEFPHPSPGIDLMIGPYQVTERTTRAPSGRAIRLRTYFHPGLESLADGYLGDVARYLELYERRLGDYPFGEFSVVSSPTPTGYGMATLTYLGIEVLKLPFIRATSLGHEVLHNWWGNGVYVDYDKGNWAEALTTFMADYAYKEAESADAAREMRLAWLRDLATLPSGEDFPLRAFTSRTHSASQIVGYRKGAMVFFVLRDLIGPQAFAAGLRAFWKEQRFRIATWRDLQRAFEQASGRKLDRFFAQWLDRRGVPQVRIDSASSNSVALAQDGPPYELQVPVVVRTDGGDESQSLPLDTARKTFPIATKARPREVVLDPDARVLRRLLSDEAAPILRRVAVDPKLGTVLLNTSDAARKLAEALAEHPLRTVSYGAEPLLVIGLHGEVDAWLAQHRLPPRPSSLAGKGTSQVWTVARDKAEPLAIASAKDAATLEALARPLPHYGSFSYLIFDGPRAIERGVWPARPQTLLLEQR